MGRLVTFTISWTNDYDDWLEVLELDETTSTEEEIKKAIAENVADAFTEDMQWVIPSDIEVTLPND